MKKVYSIKSVFLISENRNMAMRHEERRQMTSLGQRDGDAAGGAGGNEEGVGVDPGRAAGAVHRHQDPRTLTLAVARNGFVLLDVDLQFQTPTGA